MKMLVLLAAAASAAAFFPLKATASSGGPLILNVSGTIMVQESYTNYTSTETNINTITTFSFNQKYIYNLISNSVASTNFPFLLRTNMPPDGYIAFDPTNAFNENVTNGDYYSSGVFYVTNKAGFSYKLNGFDSHGDFYSYIELNDDDVGFYNNFYGAFKGSESTKTQIGTYAETETADLFIHDNPYAYDAGDHPNVILNNETAIEIRSTLKATLVYEGPYTVLSNDRDVSTGGGTGSAVIGAFADGVDATVSSGHFSLLP